MIVNQIENLAIFLIILSGIANILISLPNASGFLLDISNYYSHLSNANAAINMLLRRMVGFILLMISYHLYKRKLLAWTIALIGITISVTLHIVRFRMFSNPFVIIGLFIITVLIIFAEDFFRESDKLSIKRALALAVCSFGLILLNTAIGFFGLKGHYSGLMDFIICFINAIKLLFFMDTSAFATTKIELIYANFSIALNWFCILVGLFLLLKPLIYNPMVTKNDKAKVHELVKKFGQNPLVHLALENDKKYFFGNQQEGVIAFAVVGDVAVCCGDIICSEEYALEFFSEFMGFCKKQYYSIVMINVTDKFLLLYKKMGFESVKYGEDACFKLSDYNLKGGKVAKVRAAINHANKLGVTVKEYKPKIKRERDIEHDINEVSREWISLKKSGELNFMVGTVGLYEPYDKRYFVAIDSDNNMQGFVVFIPYDEGKAYLADVTRRRAAAPQGVIEKLIYEAFMIFKAEGVEWGSMGLSPLANIRDDDADSKLTTKLFEYIYENLNDIYGFKQLHHAKEKYSPTHWISRYLVYYPKIFTPKIAYAIVRVRLPNTLRSAVASILKRWLNKKEKK